MTTLYLATRNPGKIREFNRILESLPGGVRAAAPDPAMPEVEESGATFEANARIKAEALSSVHDGWVVGVGMDLDGRYRELDAIAVVEGAE